MNFPKIHAPVVTVISPTWQRHEYLFERCIPSVDRQTYEYVEHIVISDGPDDALRARMAVEAPWIKYLELPEHPPHKHWGNPARLYALQHATGEYITYCDDDDMLRPEHCELGAQCLNENPACGLAISRMTSHNPGGEFIIGWGPPANGNVGTPMLTHRREILQIATWGEDCANEDFKLVESWISAGVRYARIDAETIDVWPSIYR